MIEQFMDFLPYISAAISAITGWLIGKRKSDNDFISDLQDSINILTKDNKELRLELINLSNEYQEQTFLFNKMSHENADLKREICLVKEELTKVIGLNRIKGKRKRKQKKATPPVSE